MNIFAIDADPRIAAKHLMDKHVVKMALETAQILSTISGGPYKPTHTTHPVMIWTAQSYDNFLWVKRHGMAICQEYTERYQRIHKCEDVIRHQYPRRQLPDLGLQVFVQCMPDEFMHPDPIIAYRAYYHSKARFATWKQNQPYWWRKS